MNDINPQDEDLDPCSVAVAAVAWVTVAGVMALAVLMYPAQLFSLVMP